MKILLICSAGMSTSMLVRKMQESAVNQNIDAEIWAVGVAESSANIPKADIILLGPQVRFMKDKIQLQAKETIVDVIDMVAYGKMDGEAVLNCVKARLNIE